MGSVNLVVIVESVKELLKHGNNGLNKFHLASVLAVSAALGGLPLFTHVVCAN
jgi:hypothetical protein